MAYAAVHANVADDAQDNVLGRDAVGQRAVHAHLHSLGPRQSQALRAQYLLDLGGPDGHCQRAQGAVRGGVAIAADDGLTRLRVALLRPYDVHDALAGAVHVVEGEPELVAVVGQRLHLPARRLVRDGQGAVGGRHVVVCRADREVRPAYLAPCHAQPIEGLRRGDLVHQVQVHVDYGGLSGLFVDYVGVPNLLEHGLGHVDFPPM